MSKAHDMARVRAAGAAAARTSARLSPAATLLLVVAAALAPPAAAQQLTPFQGRNRPQPGSTDVYVNVLVDRLLCE